VGETRWIGPDLPTRAERDTLIERVRDDLQPPPEEGDELHVTETVWRCKTSRSWVVLNLAASMSES
jgi:hypothetical protein